MSGLDVKKTSSSVEVTPEQTRQIVMLRNFASGVDNDGTKGFSIKDFLKKTKVVLEDGTLPEEYCEDPDDYSFLNNLLEYGYIVIEKEFKGGKKQLGINKSMVAKIKTISAGKSPTTLDAKTFEIVKTFVYYMEDHPSEFRKMNTGSVDMEGRLEGKRSTKKENTKVDEVEIKKEKTEVITSTKKEEAEVKEKLTTLEDVKIAELKQNIIRAITNDSLKTLNNYVSPGTSKYEILGVIPPSGIAVIVDLPGFLRDEDITLTPEHIKGTPIISTKKNEDDEYDYVFDGGIILDLSKEDRKVDEKPVVTDDTKDAPKTTPTSEHDDISYPDYVSVDRPSTSPGADAVIEDTSYALADTITLKSGEQVQLYKDTSYEEFGESYDKNPKNNKQALDWIAKGEHGVNLYKNKGGKYITWDELPKNERKQIEKIRNAARHINISSMDTVLQAYSGYGTTGLPAIKKDMIWRKESSENKDKGLEDYWKYFWSDKNSDNNIGKYMYKKGGSKRKERKKLIDFSITSIQEKDKAFSTNVMRYVRYLRTSSAGQVSAHQGNEMVKSYQALRLGSVIEAYRKQTDVDMDKAMALFLGDLDFDKVIENPSIVMQTWKQKEKDQKEMGKGALMEGQTVALYHKAKQYLELQMGDVDKKTIERAVVQNIMNVISLLQANPQALKEEGDKLGYVGIKQLFDPDLVKGNPINTPDELLNLFQTHPQTFLFIRDLFASNPEYAFYMMSHGAAFGQQAVRRATHEQMRPEGKKEIIKKEERDLILETEDREELLAKLDSETREALIQRLDIKYKELYIQLKAEVLKMENRKALLEKRSDQLGLDTKDTKELEELRALLPEMQDSLAMFAANEEKNKVMFSADIIGAVISLVEQNKGVGLGGGLNWIHEEGFVKIKGKSIIDGIHLSGGYFQGLEGQKPGSLGVALSFSGSQALSDKLSWFYSAGVGAGAGVKGLSLQNLVKGVDVFAVTGLEMELNNLENKKTLDAKAQHYGGLVGNYSFLFGSFGATAYWRKDTMKGIDTIHQQLIGSIRPVISSIISKGALTEPQIIPIIEQLIEAEFGKDTKHKEMIHAAAKNLAASLSGYRNMFEGFDDMYATQLVHLGVDKQKAKDIAKNSVIDELSHSYASARRNGQVENMSKWKDGLSSFGLGVQVLSTPMGMIPLPTVGLTVSWYKKVIYAQDPESARRAQELLEYGYGVERIGGHKTFAELVPNLNRFMNLQHTLVDDAGNETQKDQLGVSLETIEGHVAIPAGALSGVNVHIQDTIRPYLARVEKGGVTYLMVPASMPVTITPVFSGTHMAYHLIIGDIGIHSAKRLKEEDIVKFTNDTSRVHGYEKAYGEEREKAVLAAQVENIEQTRSDLQSAYEHIEVVDGKETKKVNKRLELKKLISGMEMKDGNIVIQTEKKISGFSGTGSVGKMRTVTGPDGRSRIELPYEQIGHITFTHNTSTGELLVGYDTNDKEGALRNRLSFSYNETTPGVSKKVTPSGAVIETSSNIESLDYKAAEVDEEVIEHFRTTIGTKEILTLRRKAKKAFYDAIEGENFAIAQDLVMQYAPTLGAKLGSDHVHANLHYIYGALSRVRMTEMKHLSASEAQATGADLVKKLGKTNKLGTIVDDILSGKATFAEHKPLIEKELGVQLRNDSYNLDVRRSNPHAYTLAYLLADTATIVQTRTSAYKMRLAQGEPEYTDAAALQNLMDIRKESLDKMNCVSGCPRDPMPGAIALVSGYAGDRYANPPSGHIQEKYVSHPDIVVNSKRLITLDDAYAMTHLSYFMKNLAQDRFSVVKGIADQINAAAPGTLDMKKLENVDSNEITRLLRLLTGQETAVIDGATVAISTTFSFAYFAECLNESIIMEEVKITKTKIPETPVVPDPEIIVEPEVPDFIGPEIKVPPLDVPDPELGVFFNSITIANQALRRRKDFALLGIGGDPSKANERVLSDSHTEIKDFTEFMEGLSDAERQVIIDAMSTEVQPGFTITVDGVIHTVDGWSIPGTDMIVYKDTFSGGLPSFKVYNTITNEWMEVYHVFADNSAVLQAIAAKSNEMNAYINYMQSQQHLNPNK